MDPQEQPDQEKPQQFVSGSKNVAQAIGRSISIVVENLNINLSTPTWWERYRLYILSVTIVIPLVVWQWHQISWYVNLSLARSMEGKVNIALAAFPPGLEQVRPALEEELRSSLENLRVLDDDIQFETFAAYVDSGQRAEALARKVNAQLVIWARADEDSGEVRTRFTILVFDEDIEVAETLNDTPIPRNNATDHFQWRSEVIATFIKGVSFLIDGEHEPAFNNFVKAEEITDEQINQENKEVLQRIKAVLLLYMGRSKAAILAEDPDYTVWGCDAPDTAQDKCMSPEEMYQAIVNRYPEYSWAYIGLGNVAFAQSAIEEDVSLLEQAESHYEEALRLEGDKPIDLPPAEANVEVKARLNLGNVALERSLYEAIGTDEWDTHLECAFEQYALVAHEEDAAPRYRAHGYYGLASVQMERQDAANAEVNAQMCIDLAKDDIRAEGLVTQCTNLRDLASNHQREAAETN
jgi:hypothetical protein